MVVRRTCGHETNRTKTNEDETFSKEEKSKNQPEREFLRNAENPEFHKIRNKKQKYTKPELPKFPAKREESQKNKNKQNENKTAQASLHEEARAGLALSKCAINASRRQATGKVKELLAVWNQCNVVSCNVVYARGIQEALPSAWHASKHRC